MAKPEGEELKGQPRSSMSQPRPSMTRRATPAPSSVSSAAPAGASQQSAPRASSEEGAAPAGASQQSAPRTSKRGRAPSDERSPKGGWPKRGSPQKPTRQAPEKNDAEKEIASSLKSAAGGALSKKAKRFSLRITSTGNEAARMRFIRQARSKYTGGISDNALAKFSGGRCARANLFTIWMQHQEDWKATSEFVAVIERSKSSIVKTVCSFKKRKKLVEEYGEVKVARGCNFSRP